MDESDSESGFRASVDVGTMRTAVETVRALVGESCLRFAPDGLHVRATDPATVASVALDLDAAAFEIYRADGGLVGVDLDRLADLLGIAGRDQIVRFALDPDRRTLAVEIDGLDYTMGLLDPDSIRSPPDPEKLDFEYAAEAVVGSDVLDRAVRASGMVADHVAVRMDEASGVLTVAADGDTDDVALTLDGDDLVELSLGSADSLFSLDYLADIDRAIDAGTPLRLRFGTEIPLAIEYGFADDAGRVEYVLAPRMSVA